jgi:OmpA-OmpF porin, OOP family
MNNCLVEGAPMRKTFSRFAVSVVALTALMTSLISFNALADDEAESDYDRYEIGIAGGTSHAVAGETFKQAADSGDNMSYWIGYGLEKNLGVELGLDYFDFDKLNSKHQAISALGVYRFYADSWIHPIGKLGLGSVGSINALDEKTNAFGFKAAGGLEADFKYASVGGLLNYFYITKASEAASMKDVQVFVPTLFLTLHNDVLSDTKSEPVAPQASAEHVRKDSDNDGVYDEDDKCTNTPAGTMVNLYGCSEKEKATVKLNVEFATGKADIDPKFNSEIQSLSAFMLKFPETKVEIGGYSDDQGSAARNISLSQKRADAVKKSLVTMGVDAARLTSKGYGPANPVADNKTVEGRAQNRRVMAEISVMTDKKK